MNVQVKQGFLVCLSSRAGDKDRYIIDSIKEETPVSCATVLQHKLVHDHCLQLHLHHQKTWFLIRLFFAVFDHAFSLQNIFLSSIIFKFIHCFFSCVFSAHLLSAFSSFTLSQNIPSNLPLHHFSPLSLLVCGLIPSTSLSLYTSLFQISQFFVEAHNVYLYTNCIKEIKNNTKRHKCHCDNTFLSDYIVLFVSGSVQVLLHLSIRNACRKGMFLRRSCWVLTCV